MSSEGASLYSRKNPYPAQHTVNQRLSGPESEKETRHHVIDLGDSKLEYVVGDALGVFGSNDPKLVDEILETIGFSGTEEILAADAKTKSLREALLTDYVITQPSKEFLAALSAKGGDGTEHIRRLTTDPLEKDALSQYLWGMEFIDFLSEHRSISWEPQEFVKTLRKLQPRLYSIASSMKAVGTTVELTIATVRYESHGRQRAGVVSSFLADRTTPETKVPVFVHTAKHFRLPEDPATNIIMVGPGTGVAPFRAYLQERKATGAAGKNWLFFGEQRRASDFLYEQELTKLQEEGVLNRLDLAFSRDIAGQKVYVQHKMKENSRELYDWLENGAHFFICGDGARMAKDVDAELHAIAEREGGKTPEQAAEWVEALKKTKRYKKDVY